MLFFRTSPDKSSQFPPTNCQFSLLLISKALFLDLAMQLNKYFDIHTKIYLIYFCMWEVLKYACSMVCGKFNLGGSKIIK